jgi:amino acid adenylation domain-containing protein
VSRLSAPDLAERIARLTPEQRAYMEQRLRGRGAEVPRTESIPRRADRGAAPLSFAQQRLWFLDQLVPGNPFYNIFDAYRLRGVLDRDAVGRALEAIVARHEALRTTFAVVDGRPVQVIAANQRVEIPVADSGVGRAEREKRAQEWISATARRPFDLGRGPLLVAGLLRLDEEEHVLLLTMHHIVSDGWSMGVFIQELARFYEEFSGGPPAALPEPPIQYADFAVWQREWLSGEVLEEQLSYWSRQLTDLPVLELPTDRPRPPVQSFRGREHSISFPKTLTEGLSELSRREGATLFMTLLAAFQVLLARYTGQEDVVVGSPIAGRTDVETEGLIGFFVNTLVLRGDLSGKPSFCEFLRRVRETALGAYAHQDLPFEKLVEELKPERDLSQNPLFQVLFALQNAPASPFELAGLKVTPLPADSRTTHFDLEVYVGEEPGGLTCTFVYATDLFDAGTIVRMMGHYQTLLGAIVADANQRVSELAILTEAERRQVVEEWNQTEAEYPREKTVHELFEEQAERTPEAEALVFGEQRVSFGELDRRANRLAHFLRRRGVGPEVFVGVCLERSADAVTALLAVLKAGGAYVPMDPAYPAERLAFMLEDSGARVLVTRRGAGGRSGAPAGVEVVDIDEEAEAIARESGQKPHAAAGPESAAYVIYTSGSTGSPKGVVGLHRASVNRFSWMWRAFPFSPGEVCCQRTALSFVDSIWEIFGPLLGGIPLVIFSDEVVQDPRSLVERLAATQVTRIVLVPSLLRAILESEKELSRRLPKLWHWVVSGEVLTSELADRFGVELPGRALINLYGSSEVAADVTCYDARRRRPGEPVAIGLPIANSRAYVLDRHRQPVPVGIPGELYIGGDNVARGYWNRPELTAERFLRDPFRVGARIYRTGDRARFLPYGDIQFLGRFDDQVKIRGFRIEPGEIETALTQHPGVREAVVVAREDLHGQRRLVAYVVGKEGMPGSIDLREFLKEKLPEFMVPSTFVALEALPLTPSGKVDRRALPAPEGDRPELQEAYLAPRTHTEEVLADVWAQVLGLDRVGVHDNFFELGGHSLLAMQVVSRLRKAFQRELPIRWFFEVPSVAQLAARVDTAESDDIARILDELESLPEKDTDRLEIGNEPPIRA